MKHIYLIILGLGVFLVNVRADTSQIPACAQNCCTQNGQTGGTDKETCATYCGTQLTDAVKDVLGNSVLVQCKDMCVHNCPSTKP